MTKITPTEIAKKWKVSRTTIYDKMNSGELTYTTSGKSRKIDVSEVVRVFGEVSENRSHKTDVTATLQQEIIDNSAQLAELKKDLAHQKEMYQALEKRLESEQQRTNEQKEIIADYRELLKQREPKGLLSWFKK